MSYKFVVYCRGCKTRFTQERGERKKSYCDTCQASFEARRAKEIAK